MTAQDETLTALSGGGEVGGDAASTPVIVAWVTAMLGFAAAAWAVTVREMDGMDMGVATRLGALGSFLGLWVAMMAAMMLPGVVPASVGRLRAGARGFAVPAFIGSYLAVWALVGVGVYAVYRPHGYLAAGLATIVAGAYELTPLKRRCRHRCRRPIRSGADLGLHCVGSSAGLMLVLVAVGPMSVPWMAVISVPVVAQKLLPVRPAVDVSLALALIGLGVLIAGAPSSAPGLTPSM